MRTDGMGRPWRIIKMPCHQCGEETELIARIHVPDNDWDRTYCPKCLEEAKAEK